MYYCLESVMRSRYSIILALLMLPGAVTAISAGADVPVSTSKPSVESVKSSLLLSITDAIKLAQAHSPTTREALAHVAGASSQIRAARAPQNPMLGLGHGFGSDTGGLDEDMLLTQVLPVPGKRQPAIKAAQLEHQAALSDQADSTLDLIFAVKSAYYEALRADEGYQLASDTLAVTKKFAELAQVQYQAGDVPRSNTVRSDIETSRAQQELDAAETERTECYNTLKSITGEPDQATLALTDKLSFAPVDYDLADLQNRALNNRPDLRAAKLQCESLSESVKGARAQWIPDPFVEARHSTLNSLTGGSSIRIGIALPFVDLGGNRANVDTAKAAVSEQQARLDEQTRVARLEVENAYHSLGKARRAVESFQTGRLSRAKELLDMAQTGFEKGAASYLELLDAQQVYRNEQADYTRALADYNIAAADLLRAVGGEAK